MFLKRINKISDKIIFFNTTMSFLSILLISIIGLLLSVFFVVEDENVELVRIADKTIDKFSKSSLSEIKKSYELLLIEDKAEINIYMKEKDKTLLLGDLTKDEVEYIIEDEYWTFLKSNGFFYSINKTTNGRSYYFIRRYHLDDLIKSFEKVFFLSLVIVFLNFLISLISSKKILLPLTNVITTAKEIDESNLGIRLPKETDDELGELVEVLNSSFESIENAYNSQKKFSQDASHELKTPIAVIKGYLEILEWGKDDPKLLNESLESIEEEVSNINLLIEKLFQLTKLETVKLNSTKFNLYELLSRIQQDYKVIGSDRIKLKETDLAILGDEELLLQGIRAVIDNALKFSEEDILISCEEIKEYILIKIKDKGIGMSKEEIKNVTKRFYKVSESRTRKGNGMGLGLSIVNEIINLHSGKLIIQSQPNRGTTMILALKNNYINICFF